MIELKFSELIQANNNLGKDLINNERIELKVLSNITINQFVPIIEYSLRKENLNAHVKIGDYDNILQESIIIAPREIPIIFWEACNIKDSFVYEVELMDDLSFSSYLQKFENELDILINNLKSCRVVLFNKFSHTIFTYTNLKINKYEEFINRMNFILMNKLPSNFLLIDIDKILAKVSVSHSVDIRNFYSNKTLYTLDFLKAYATFISPIIFSLYSKTKKALIFDCDNTLWKGIVGEDGINMIEISNKDKNGIFFKDVQLIAKSLISKGIILGLCSKNNHEDVLEVFAKRQDITLKESDFSVQKVNWNNKASNLKEIAEELNIGIDSLVFVDDSQFELSLVNEVLPQIKTIAVPEKLYEYPSLISKTLNLFYSIVTTKEDLKRVEMYKENMQRNKVKKSYSNIDAYLESLGITIEITNECGEIIDRLSQMTQKTNQFNLTTHRYSTTEISFFQNSIDYDLISLVVSDKFGSSGVTGMCVIKYNGHLAEIDSLLLSCRILGRNIETVFLNEIIKYIYQKGIKKVKSSFIKTIKNSQVENFYDKHSFTLIESNENERFYELDLDKLNNTTDLNYIKVLWKKK